MNNVLWIRGNPPVRLAVVLRPDGVPWLRDSLLGAKQAGVQTIISLLEPDEAVWLGLADEGPLAEEIGMSFLSFPIRDMQVPSDTARFRTFVAGLAARLRAGESLGVHCRGSIGRTTIAAACTLIHLGWKPEDAVAAIEAARGCPVPNTAEQLRWIMRYQAEP
jgi:protein-tyrosine phosphatase